MAKTVKRAAARKQTSKRSATKAKSAGKTAAKRVTAKKAKAKTQRTATSAAKTARKKAAKRAAPKKARSKAQKVVRSAAKTAAKGQRITKTAARKAPRNMTEMQLETTIIDVIEEPAPGVVVVTEYELIEETPTSPGDEPEGGESVGQG